MLSVGTVNHLQSSNLTIRVSSKKPAALTHDSRAFDNCLKVMYQPSVPWVAC